MSSKASHAALHLKPKPANIIMHTTNAGATKCRHRNERGCNLIICAFQVP
jgi:hypothetical protein